MKPHLKRISCTLAALALVLTAVPTLAADRHFQAKGRDYEVTITNLTQGQIFSPPVVFSHRSGYELFTPSQPASPELAGLAEDADSEPLLALLAAEPRVGDVSIAEGVVLPGQSTTVRISGKGNARMISTLGMLVTTNDAFFATTKRAPNYFFSAY